MKVFESLLERARQSVLIVDDEPVILQILDGLLTDAGLTVHCAGTAVEARRVFKTTPIGAAILDKNMPDTDGIQLLREIKREAPLVQVMIMTGYASLESAIDAVREHAFEYIAKPFESDVIIRKVGLALAEFSRLLEKAEDETRHDSLFESIPGLVWFVADEGKITRINSAGAEVLGYDASELEGAEYKVLLGDDEDAEWAFKERRAAPRATAPKRVSLKAKDGADRVFEVHSAGTYASIDGTGERAFTGTVGVAADITDQLRLEEALRHNQKMEALGSLAGGVAHDYNNLLTIIGACVHMFADETLSTRAESALRDLSLACQRATDLTRQLLTFSHQRSQHVEDVDVIGSLRSAQMMLRRLVRENVTFEMELPEQTFFVSLPPAALEQIMLNLIANARDAMPDGGHIKLEVSRAQLDGCPPQLKPANYICIAASDTGTGMDEATRSRAFDPFFTTKKINEGTGLGLATIYGLATSHGGTATIDSEPGRGTTVSIFLPVVESPVARLPRPSTDVSGFDGPGAAVLVVEDDELVRRSTLSILEGAGIEVICASSGEEAIERYLQSDSPIGTLVTDVVMPGISGRILARKLRELDPTLGVIYMSGYAPDESGANVPGVFIGKPYRPDDLVFQVRKLLAKRQALSPPVLSEA